MRIDAAMTGLVAVVTTALADLDADVLDGPPAHPSEKPITVSLGLGFNEEPPVTLDADPTGLGVHGDGRLVVRCLAMALGQVDADLGTLRTTLTDALDRVDAAISQNKTLDGVVADSWIGSVQRYWPGRTNEAAIYTAAFDIHATLLT